MTDDVRRKVQEQFGSFAQNYVNSPIHSSSYSLERLLELVDVRPGQRALDVATGGGHVALGLAKQDARVVATDLTPKMLAAARPYIDEHAGEDRAVNYGQADALAIPFGDNSFDLLTCRIAPHHFPDVAQFVKEAARVVRPGGVVAVVDQIAPPDTEGAKFVNAFEELRDPSHVWEYAQTEWEDFFTAANLKIVHREVCRNRLEFGWWTKMQNVAPETVTRLQVMLHQAPPAAAEWLQPELSEGGPAYFSLWQLILIGVKN